MEPAIEMLLTSKRRTGALATAKHSIASCVGLTLIQGPVEGMPTELLLGGAKIA